MGYISRYRLASQRCIMYTQDFRISGIKVLRLNQIIGTGKLGVKSQMYNSKNIYFTVVVYLIGPLPAF